MLTIQLVEKLENVNKLFLKIQDIIPIELDEPSVKDAFNIFLLQAIEEDVSPYVLANDICEVLSLRKKGNLYPLNKMLEKELPLLTKQP